MSVEWTLWLALNMSPAYSVAYLYPDLSGEPAFDLTALQPSVHFVLGCGGEKRHSIRKERETNSVPSQLTFTWAAVGTLPQKGSLIKACLHTMHTLSNRGAQSLVGAPSHPGTRGDEKTESKPADRFWEFGKSAGFLGVALKLNWRYSESVQS